MSFFSRPLRLFLTLGLHAINRGGVSGEFDGRFIFRGPFSFTETVGLSLSVTNE